MRLALSLRSNLLERNQSTTGLLRLLGLVDQQNGNSIAHGIDALAGGALHESLVGAQLERFAALRHGTDQDIEQLLEDHGIMIADF